MALKPNAKCDICGKQYYTCNLCSEVKSFTPWKIITDTLEHYEIFLVLSEYSSTKNKEKAKQELQKCDLTGFKSFNENIKAAINEIMDDFTTHKVINKKNKTLNENKPVKKVRQKSSVKTIENNEE